MDLAHRKVTASVVIPAFNEEQYLAPTLEAVFRSAQQAKAAYNGNTEVILVDNESTDRTAEIAREFGVRVVSEADHNVARVRNRGARESVGEILVFVDADTLVPEELLARIYRLVLMDGCLGGAVEAECRPRRSSVRFYLGLWRVLARFANMAQGATQFCRREAFEEIGGYDASILMGEDTDFFFAYGIAPVLKKPTSA